MSLFNRPGRILAVNVALSLMAQSSVPVVIAAAGGGQTAATKPPASPPSTAQAPPAKPTTPPAAKPASPAASRSNAANQPVDGGWPRAYTLAGGGSVVVYQPQIAEWPQQKHVVAYSAVSYRAKAADKAAMGTIKLEADTQTSVAERLVNFQNLKIVEANFGMLPKESVQQITSTITAAIPNDDRVIALDRVLANIDTSSVVPKNEEGVKADPPTIFFSQTPAVIVNFDGEPIWSPIKDNNLRFAVNTNWDVFELDTPEGKAYYLRNNVNWLKSSDVKGSWSPAGKLPDSFGKLPAEENWKDVKENLPGKSIKASEVPKVFVSFEPAELILLRGNPNYLTVPGTKLLWVSNTDSDLFRLGKGGTLYYLVAGRWFSAPDFMGPWTFASTSLPEDFKEIPLEHERSRVLASVPGSPEAIQAVLVAQIPQTARVNRKETKAPDVAFQGDPQFVPIETTTVQRAVNTDKDVFKFGDAYYLCYNGIWFTGKSSTGPWEVATSIPQEIYKIPMSSPSHHVTYVTVEESNNDTAVFAAAAGYTGMMIAFGCVVWGSGYYYPPYYGYGGFYPYYYPHFPTYGYSAWYNPYTGGYGRSAGVYGPYGGAGVGARYNPRTGTYARGAAAYGPYGARGVAQAYNPRTGTYASTRQGSNVYGSWGSTAVQRGDDWAVTNRYTNNRTGNTTRTVRTDEGNVYAGKDGNAYRRQDGTWQKYDNGGWNNTDRQPDGSAQQRASDAAANRPSTMDSSTRDQLNRDSAARTEGTQRSQDLNSYRGSSGTSNTGSYRSGGGASRGGGMSRGGGGRRR